MFEKKFLMPLLCLFVALSLSATATRGANILFVSSMSEEHMVGDDALKAFMEGLGHTVTYIDDDEDEATTEAEAAAADMVFISESVGSGGIRDEITEIEVPMIVGEPWAWDEMGLTEGDGGDDPAVTTDVEIVDPGHYIAAGLSGTVAVLTDIPAGCNLGKGITGPEATVIATATLSDGQTYDVIFVYEKGAALPVAPADGSAQVAADIRIGIGFHANCYPALGDNYYALLGAAIDYALGLAAALPDGWQSQDIGTTGGSAAESDGTWVISADGADVWGTADEFHYAYVPLSGDGTIIARVVDNGTGSNTWAKGGVMIRQSLDAGSTHAIMAVTGGDGGGGAFQWRPVADGDSISAHDDAAGIAPGYWMKLERVGNAISGSYSPDGAEWTQQGDAQTIEMTDPVLIGLFVTSHASGELRTYTFDNVSVVTTFDVTAPGDAIQGVPNDGDWPPNETPDLAIDDNIETKYLHFKGDFDPDPGTGGAGFQVTPAAGPTIVTGLTLTTANDVPGRDPIAFELSGSNDSIDGPYTVIASGDVVDFAGEAEWPRFTINATPISFKNDTAYAHYQLIFTAIRGPVGGSVNSMQIAEVELLGVPAPAAPELVAAFAFGSRLLDCPTYNDPTVNYTMVLHESPESVQYNPDRGYGYEVLYPTDSPYGDRSGYGVFGPFDDSPNNRSKFGDECPEELYDSFIGAKDFLTEVSAATMGDMDTPSPDPEGIIFRVDVPNGLYRFVGAFADADNVHAHRILAEDGGSGPPENIGANYVVLVSNHDQAQQTIGEADAAEPGEGVYARVGFDGLIPPPGDGVAPSPQFVDMDENGMATDAGANSPILEVTQGYIRIHQLQGNSNDGPGGPRDANGGDAVILELWKID